MPSIPNSVRTAGFILLAFAVYFLVRGAMPSSAKDAETDVSSPTASIEAALPEVIVRPVELSEHSVTASLKGSTEPDREITVRSQTVGTVTYAGVNEGQMVKRGTLLCGLDVESRSARVAEAEAGVQAALLEHEAAMQLEVKGWTTSNRAAATKATLDQAEAALASARIEMGRTRIVAPFDGVFEARLAERGDFLSMGAPCGQLVDLDPIIVAVDATEHQLQAIDTEAPVNVVLATGQAVTGKVRFVARTANSETRTFRVEVEVPNPDASISAGLTATVDINLGEAQATLLTPASLVLHDDGRVGVRYVDHDEIIQFAEVTIVDDASDGIWVTGLPDGVNLLTAGQDYLREGIKVTALTSQGAE